MRGSRLGHRVTIIGRSGYRATAVPVRVRWWTQTAAGPHAGRSEDEAEKRGDAAGCHAPGAALARRLSTKAIHSGRLPGQAHKRYQRPYCLIGVLASGMRNTPVRTTAAVV